MEKIIKKDIIKTEEESKGKEKSRIVLFSFCFISLTLSFEEPVAGHPHINQGRCIILTVSFTFLTQRFSYLQAALGGGRRGEGRQLGYIVCKDSYQRWGAALITPLV